MNTDNLGRLGKYKDSLRVEGDKIFSYRVHVADIDHTNRTVVKLGCWSSTASKHINYVAGELGYETVGIEMSREVVRAYRRVGAYTVSAVSKAIKELAETKTEDQNVRALLMGRKAELEKALEVIDVDLERVE